jgi:imidazole glycerol phosphate synthase subunit HisF
MGVPLILFGGISEKSQVNSFFAHPSVIAVAVGNFLHYEEHAIQGYKEAMILDCCRPPQYIRS